MEMVASEVLAGSARMARASVEVNNDAKTGGPELTATRKLFAPSPGSKLMMTSIDWPPTTGMLFVGRTWRIAAVVKLNARPSGGTGAPLVFTHERPASS